MGSNNDSSIWKTLTRIGIVVGIIAGVFATWGVIRSFNTPTTTADSAQNTPDISTGHGGTATVPRSVPTASPTPSPTARPVSSGTVFCNAGGSNGWDGWPVTGSWHLVNGNLLNDGSDSGGSMGPNLVAPDVCQPTIPDYSMTASFKLDRVAYGVGYGIDVRGVLGQNGWEGYTGWMYAYQAASLQGEARIWTACCNEGGSDLSDVAYDIDYNWHTFEVTVRGNSIAFKIDGGTVLSTTDARYLSPGQVGLWCREGTQVEVSSVKVVAL